MERFSRKDFAIVAPQASNASAKCRRPSAVLHRQRAPSAKRQAKSGCIVNADRVAARNCEKAADGENTLEDAGCEAVSSTFPAFLSVGEMRHAPCRARAAAGPDRGRRGSA